MKAAHFYTRSLIEANIDDLMATDPLGVITDVNRQMCEMSGYTREELLGTPFKRYFTDPKRAEDGIRRVLSEDRVTNYELTLRAKDGHEAVVSYNANIFRDGAGCLQGVFASARDITAQKDLEEKLRQVQNYTRGLIEASVDALVTVDHQGRITDVNQQLVHMTGYSREELIGSSFSDYFTDPGEARAGVQRTLERGTVTNYVLVLRTRSGSETAVSFNASIFKDTDGNVRGIFASAQTLQRSSPTRPLVDEMLHRALEASGAPRGAAYRVGPDGLLALQTSIGYQHEAASLAAGFFGRLDLLRRALESGSILEIPSADLPPAEASDLLHEARAASMVIATISSGGERLGALMAAWPSPVHEDARDFFGTTTSAQVSQAIALVHVLEDRMQLLAREQAARAEAEAAVRAREEFIAVAAHELKTPLAVLSGFAQTLARHFLEKRRVRPAWVVESANNIARQSMKLGRLVDELLDATRIGTGAVSCQEYSTDGASALGRPRAPPRQRQGLRRPAGEGRLPQPGLPGVFVPPHFMAIAAERDQVVLPPGMQGPQTPGAGAVPDTPQPAIQDATPDMGPVQVVAAADSQAVPGNAEAHPEVLAPEVGRTRGPIGDVRPLSPPGVGQYHPELVNGKSLELATKFFPRPGVMDPSPAILHFRPEGADGLNDRMGPGEAQALLGFQERHDVAPGLLVPRAQAQTLVLLYGLPIEAHAYLAQPRLQEPPGLLPGENRCVCMESADHPPPLHISDHFRQFPVKGRLASQEKGYLPDPQGCALVHDLGKSLPGHIPARRPVGARAHGAPEVTVVRRLDVHIVRGAQGTARTDGIT